jgi:hypothetical protein
MQIQDNLLHHHSLIVQRSIAQNLHHFETAVPFPRILLLHQTVAEAGIQPNSHIYIRFPLLSSAGSNSTPVEVDNGASPRQVRKLLTGQELTNLIDDMGEGSSISFSTLIPSFYIMHRPLHASHPPAPKDNNTNNVAFPR